MRSKRNVADHVSDLMARSGQLPDDAQLVRAAAILNEGGKVGDPGRPRRARCRRGARQASPSGSARRSSRRCSARAPCPTTAPITTGGIGLLGTKPSQEALEDCDTLLIAGSSFPYIEFYPKPGQARAVQIDIDSAAHRPALSGRGGAGRRHASACCRCCCRKLEQKKDRTFLEKAQKGMADWKALMNERGTRTDTPMKPQVVAHELDKLLEDDAIIATDSGTITTWIARHLDVRAAA